MRTFAVTAAAAPAILIALEIGYSQVTGHKTEAEEALNILLFLLLPIGVQLAGAIRSMPIPLFLSGTILGFLSGTLSAVQWIEMSLLSVPLRTMLLTLAVFVAELVVLFSAVHLIRLRGQTRPALITLASVVAFLVGAGFLVRLASSPPEYEDPFSESVHVVFAKAGMPVAASGAGEYVYQNRDTGFSERVLWVQIDEGLCPGGDLDCVIHHLDQQPWVTSAFTQDEDRYYQESPIGFELEGDRGQCAGDMRPLLDPDDVPLRLRKENLENDPGLWFVWLHGCHD